MVVAGELGGAGLGVDVMMPPPTSFTSRSTRHGDVPRTLLSASCRCLAAWAHRCPLILLLARRMIITLPRVMISSRRVMINPLGAQALNRFGTNPTINRQFWRRYSLAGSPLLSLGAGERSARSEELAGAGAAGQGAGPCA
jgi:hypothetical protein